MIISKPKVILSAANVNHYHYTAMALQDAGYLSKYLCMFSGPEDLKLLQPFLPANYRKKLIGKSLAKLDRDRIITFPIPYLITLALGRLKILEASQKDALLCSWYDLCTSREISNANIFHFISSVGLKSGSLAKQRRMVLICDIRSIHIEVLDEILQREYRNLGLVYNPTPLRLRERIVTEYQMADAFIVPSKYTAQIMIDRGIKPNQIHVVPYGLDIERFSGLQHNMLDDKDGVFRVLFVGSVIPRKGVHYLIQAWESLQLPNSELIIIGRCLDPSYQGLIKNMIKRTRVRFISHLPQIDLWQYYHQADLYVLPSISDSFALVVTEAMAAGLPVIVSDSTGAGELIQNNQEGFILPTGNCDALAEKIRWCYQHREHCKMMGQLASQSVQKYTWPRYQQCLLEAYNKIVTRSACL